jgi:hypothetical protein
MSLTVCAQGRYECYNCCGCKALLHMCVKLHRHWLETGAVGAHHQVAGIGKTCMCSDG